MADPLSDKAIALLPCAMCGEVPGRIVELVAGKVWSVGCNQLRHSTQAMSLLSAEDCANSWNRRAPARAASHGEDEARVEEMAKVLCLAMNANVSTCSPGGLSHKETLWRVLTDEGRRKYRVLARAALAAKGE